MAVIGELGKKYPCRTEGDPFDINDEVSEMYPGDIVEAVYEVDGTLNRQTARAIILDILKMKEEYPNFVIHYIKCETSSVIVQFSVAPAGGSISGKADTRIAGIGLTIFLICAGIALLITAIVVLPAAIRNGWIFRKRPATGHAEVIARNQETDAPIPDVEISVSGLTKTTGPNGEAVVFEDLVVGEHIFIGAAVDGFQPPDAVTARIIEASQILVTIWYKPDGYVEPDYGWLALATYPVEGDIYVLGLNEGNPVGTGYAHIEVLKGEYSVYFGPVEGWLTPPQVPLTVVGGKTTRWVAEYTKPPDEWWEKYAKYILIGGGAIIGAAILIPQIAQAAARPRRKPPEGGQ